MQQQLLRGVEHKVITGIQSLLAPTGARQCSKRAPAEERAYRIIPSISRIEGGISSLSLVAKNKRYERVASLAGVAPSSQARVIPIGIRRFLDLYTRLYIRRFFGRTLFISLLPPRIRT